MAQEYGKHRYMDDKSFQYLSGGAVGDALEQVGHLGIEGTGVGQSCKSQTMERITALVSDTTL